MSSRIEFAPGAGARQTWEKLQPLHMPRLDHVEVPVVEAGNLRLIEALRNRNDRGVYKANVQVGVLGTYLGNPTIVGKLKIDYRKRTLCDRIQEQAVYGSI
jgi:hypothetical protein